MLEITFLDIQIGGLRLLKENCLQLHLSNYGCHYSPRVGDGQGGLACCDSWGREELDTTEWLN